MRPGHFLPRVSAIKADRLAAVIVVNIVPALHHLNPARKLADRDRGAHAEVVVGNRPGKQQRAGIVPVLIRLDNLRAGRVTNSPASISTPFQDFGLKLT